MSVHYAFLIIVPAVAMVVQDVLATVMTVAESKNRAHLAAQMDSLGWMLQLVSWGVSLNAIWVQHNPGWLKASIICSVSAANYWGTYYGTKFGHYLTRREAVRAASASPDPIRD